MALYGGGGGLGGYPIGDAGGFGKPVNADKGDENVSLGRLKRQYVDYLSTKREEIDEQQDARRMRHGSQWTADEEKTLKARKQPVVTVNKISRKVHGVIGVLSRLKQDPKAYPRTPEHEEGAELATASIRYVADNNQWDSTDYYCGEMAAVDGIAGVEFNLIDGDQGDPDIEIIPFNTDSFFYDPRSYKPDFSDCRYMGVGKWLDIEEAVEMFPEKEEELRAGQESGSELTSEPDREYRWWHTDGEIRRIRVVEHWYKKGGEWYWCIYCGSCILKKGKSPWKDRFGKSMCKYVPWSAYVDQDGDRYGFVRDLKSLQRELNMRRSKSLYLGLGRRIITPKGGFDNIEIARREASRADGVVVYNPGVEKPEFDDQARMAESNSQFQFYENTQAELESFGPNVAISSGEGLERASGRAIHLLQQAGLADLGPFLQSYRAWKIRVYRFIWNAIRTHWQAERWIRVTDDEQFTHFVQLNGTRPNQFGILEPVNNIGTLDVDIIIDEGPDTVNQMADAFDTLEVLAQRGAEIPPDVLIELAPLPASLKQKLLQKLQPEPSPMEEKAMAVEMAGKEAEVFETVSSAEYKKAQAYKAYVEANNPDGAQQTVDDPRKTEAEVFEKHASAQAKLAQAEATRQGARTTQMKALSDMQNQAAQTRADVENKQATAHKTNIETRMRPYEVQNEQNKQGMDFALKREQIRKTPTGGAR